MKVSHVLGLLLAGMVLGVWIFRGPSDRQARALADKLSEQSAENERLRLFNAREVRRYKRPGAKVDWEAVSVGSHVTGAPPHLIAAVWMQENGPPDVETGVLGKTDAFSRHFPMSQWPALETGRTLNVYAWAYLCSPEGDAAFKAFLKRAAKPYTGNVQPESWAKNVYKLSHEMRK